MSACHAPAALRLNDDVHLCETGGAYVVLDLAADRYVAVTGESASALRTLLADGVSDQDPEESRTPGALGALVDAGLLVRGADRGRPLAMSNVLAPDMPLLDGAPVAHGRIAAGQAWRFLASAHAARRRLRLRPIRDTVESVRRHPPDPALDLPLARELTAAFLRLRPLFPMDRRCLFESLALLEFLGRYGLRPHWVFGVRLDPWRAHCWVQHGRRLFNDEVDEVAQYTPIMAV